jgi:hypothetical protein
MVEVDFISDRLTTKIHADNIGEIKRIVAAKLDEDVDWSQYKMKVDGTERPDTYVLMAGDTEVRAVQKGIKAGQ